MTNIQVLSLVVTGRKNVHNLSAKQSARLAQAGFIGVDLVDDTLTVTPKGERAHARNVKASRASSVQLAVEKALEEFPVGKPFRHRALWIRMGHGSFTRNEVLEGLKACRELGVVQSLKLSNNNFQIVWFTGDELVSEEAEAVADSLVSAMGFPAAAK